MIAGALLLVGALCSAEIIDLNSPDFWKNKNVAAGNSGAALEISKPSKITGKEMFEIKPNALYRVSGEIRKAPDAPTALFCPGFVLYDKDKREIHNYFIHVTPGTDTTLAEDASAGDSSIQIINGVRWTKKGGYAAFNDNPLPNRELSPLISSIKRQGTYWIVSFKKPLNKDYKAGTKVKHHSAGSFFTPVSVRKPSEEWTSFKAEIRGVSNDVERKGMFWPGSVYMTPMALVNWDWSSKTLLKTQIRNFKIEIIDGEK